MTAPTIPTEDDMQKAFEEPLAKDWPDGIDEALANNRANGLPARAPTETRRRMDDGTVMVFTTTSPAMAAAWVDDMTRDIKKRQMWITSEIDDWVADNQRCMRILQTYFPDEHWRLLDEIRAARENAHTIEL